jgi:hypothetical protein
MAVFSPTAGKSKYPYAMSEMSYFDNLGKSGHFGVPNQILRKIGRELFKTNKTGTYL